MGYPITLEQLNAKNLLYPIDNFCVRSLRICHNIVRFFRDRFQKNLLMKIVAMDVMSTGVIAYYVVVASRNGLFTPISTDPENAQRLLTPIRFLNR